MSKKTRKKSLATRAPRKAAKSAKPSARTAKKASKRISKKDSAAKQRAATTSAKKAQAKPSAASGRSKTAGKQVKVSAARATTATPPAPAPKARAVSASPAIPAPRKTISKTSSSASLESAKPAVRNPDPAGDVVAPGGAAPAFDLPRDGGGRLSLKDFAGRKLVLFFYPRASTPGCTKEAMDFTRLKGEFAATGTDVVGVSADSIKVQDSFRDKYMLAIPLVSDEQQELLKAYGAWGEKSMYGKTFMGIIRTTVLIDSMGHIARIWRHVKVDGHADEVLAAARAL